jgi:hypothetical protein
MQAGVAHAGAKPSSRHSPSRAPTAGGADTQLQPFDRGVELALGAVAHAVRANDPGGYEGDHLIRLVDGGGPPLASGAVSVLCRLGSRPKAVGG